MLDFFNAIALGGVVTLFGGLLFFGALLLRDWWRGINGLTGGLLILTAGLLLSAALGLFGSLTRSSYSPAGLVSLPVWLDQLYPLVVAGWHAAGTWVTVTGFLYIMWKNCRSGLG